MKHSAALLLTALFSQSLVAQDQTATQRRPLVIQNVTLIDMHTERPQAGITVVVRDNRITDIGKRIRTPKAAEVVDGTGKFLIPGLWDSYTFTLEAVKNKLPYFDLLIAHGVTGVRDVATSMDLQEAARLRRDVADGKVLAPRIFYAGPALLGVMPTRRSIRWTGTSTVVQTPDEARTVVDKLAEAGVDHIKTEKRTSPAILKAIIQAANAHRLPVYGVPPSYISDASNDGLRCIEHFAEIRRATSNKRDEYYVLYRDDKIDSMTTDENYAFFGTMQLDVSYYNESLKTLARNGTCVITNAALTNTFVDDYELADASRRRFKDKDQLERLDAAIAEQQRQAQNNDFRASDSNRKNNLQSVLDLHKAGVLLVAGTQLSPVSVGTPGLVLHDELEIFVRAGLSPFEALKTATVNAAKSMGRGHQLGTVQRDKLADLVLLDANPLVDISNTRKISGVVVNGRYIGREDLDARLLAVEVKVKAD